MRRAARFLLGLVLVLSDLPAFADGGDSENEGMKIVKEIVDGAVDSKVRETAMLVAYETLAKILSERAVENLALGYSVYGIAQDTEQYRKAKTEQQRYYAGMNTITDVLSFFPVTTAAAATMKLVLTGQSILASYINKEEMKKIMDIYAQAARIESETLKIKLSVAQSEFRMLSSIWRETVATLEAAEVLKSFYQTLCRNEDLEKSFVRRKSCLINAQRIAFLHGLAGRLALRVFTVPLSIIKPENFVKLMGVDQEKMKILAKTMTELSLTEAKSLQEQEVLVDREEFTALHPQLVAEAERNFAAFRCLRTAKEEVLPYLRELKLFDLKDPVDLATVEMQKEIVVKKFGVQCSPVVNSIGLHQRTLNYLTDLKKRLEFANVPLPRVAP